MTKFYVTRHQFNGLYGVENPDANFIAIRTEPILYLFIDQRSWQNDTPCIDGYGGGGGDEEQWGMGQYESLAAARKAVQAWGETRLEEDTGSADGGDDVVEIYRLGKYELLSSQETLDFITGAGSEIPVTASMSDDELHEVARALEEEANELGWSCSKGNLVSHLEWLRDSILEEEGDDI